MVTGEVKKWLKVMETELLYRLKGTDEFKEFRSSNGPWSFPVDTFTFEIKYGFFKKVEMGYFFERKIIDVSDGTYRGEKRYRRQTTQKEVIKIKQYYGPWVRLRDVKGEELEKLCQHGDKIMELFLPSFKAEFQAKKTKILNIRRKAIEERARKDKEEERKAQRMEQCATNLKRFLK